MRALDAFARERTPERPGPGPLPDTLLRALDLTIGRRVEGLLSGDYRSSQLGFGSELAQVRPYEPGDDVRARVYTDERDLYIFASDGPLPAEWLGDDVAWEAAQFDRDDDGDEDAGVEDEDGGVEDALPSANRWRGMRSR